MFIEYSEGCFVRFDTIVSVFLEETPYGLISFRYNSVDGTNISYVEDKYVDSFLAYFSTQVIK